jgi:hypothetical protein
VTYEFKCSNESCKYHKEALTIDIPLDEYTGAIKTITCPLCTSLLTRVYGSFGLKTFNDGYKA